MLLVPDNYRILFGFRRPHQFSVVPQTTAYTQRGSPKTVCEVYIATPSARRRRDMLVSQSTAKAHAGDEQPQL